MLCDHCHGKGLVQHDSRAEPCAECGGFGVLHCCEGLQAQSGEAADRPETASRLPAVDDSVV